MGSKANLHFLWISKNSISVGVLQSSKGCGEGGGESVGEVGLRIGWPLEVRDRRAEYCRKQEHGSEVGFDHQAKLVISLHEATLI